MTTVASNSWSCAIHAFNPASPNTSSISLGLRLGGLDQQVPAGRQPLRRPVGDPPVHRQAVGPAVQTRRGS